MTKLLPTQTTDTMWTKSIVFKSALTLLCLFVFQAGSLFGQVNRGITYTDMYLYGSYPATGAYTGGYQWSTSTDEVITAALPITGFTVSFGGVNYSSFHLSSNGFILLSNAAAGTPAPIGPTPINNLASIPAASGGPILAPLWDDLRVDSAGYRVAGSAASGFLAVEWQGVYWDKNAASPYLAKMQLRMYSSAHSTLAGRILFYYQPIVPTVPQAYGPYNGTSGGASIGFADLCGGDYYSVVQSTAPVNLPGWNNGTASKSLHTNNINNLGYANSTLAQVQTMQFDKAPPANDQCANYRDLGSIPAGACTATIGTLIGATITGTPVGFCDPANTNDVWFRITKPANATTFRVTTDFAPLCKGVTTSLEVYSGTCGALVSMGCSTNGGTINANNAVVIVSDPANTCNVTNYYIRVAGDAAAQGEFSLCVENFAASNCANATVIPATLPQSYTCQTTCGAVSDYNSTMGCLSPYMNGEDFVYSYTPTSIANSCIRINVTNTGAGSNPGIFVLDNCPNAGGVNCIASNTSAGPAVSISSVSLTVGTTYYIVVSNNNTPACIPFDIQIQTAGLAPVNDDPCQAGVPMLTVGGASCTWTAAGYSNNCASGTTAGTPPAPGCGNYNGGDIWFRFTVPASGNVNIDTRPGVSNPMGDGAMAVYSSGGCSGPFTLIGCATSGSSANALYPFLSISGRTPGEVIYIRVWSENNASNGSIEFCLSSSCNAYDEPCNATPLTVTTGGVPVYSTFTNVCATTSTGMPGNTCATAPRNDVWIRVIVPPSGGLTITGLVGPTGTGMRDPVLQVYRGTCTALVQVACNDDAGPGLAPEITLCGGLTPGETLWLRIWPYGTGTPVDGTFELAAYETSPASAPNPYQNDDPCNITTNMPVTTGTCSAYTTLSLRCQTPTTGYAGIPVPVNCDPFWAPGWDPCNDTWVRITVPPGITSANFLTTPGSVTDDQMVVYRSTSCSTMTQLACDDLSGPGLMPYISLGGLIPGETLYIRHYIWHGGTTRTGDFGFCIETPCSTNVANDNPCQALPLTVNAGCIYTPYTTQCATNTVQGGVPTTVATCGNFNTTSRDVWFTLTVPTSGTVSIDMRSITIPDALMAIYSAPSCSGTFTQIACNDNSSVNPAMPYLLLVGQTPGAVLYVRVWAKNGLSGGFELCVVDQCPAGPPTNDLPCNAQALTLGTSYTGFNSCTDGTSEPYPPTGGGSPPGCWSNSGGISQLNTVWYTFTAPPSGQVRIRTTLGSLTNTQIALYQGAFCFSLTPYGGTSCNDDYTQCGVSTFASELIATGLTPGVVYYVVVDGRNGLTGTFGITIYDNSIPLPPVPQQDCVLPTSICALQTTFGSPGFQGAGNICDLGNTAAAYGCVPATGARENNSAFFTFTIATAGNLFFDIIPTSNINYDWVLWNITSSLPLTSACAAISANTQTIVSCNYSTTGGTTGMQSIGACTICMPADAPFSSDIVVAPGQTYMLMINNTSGLSAGFTLDFGATSVINTAAPTLLNWTGGVDDTWPNVNNWGGCGSPTCGTSANINGGPLNQPVLTANEQVNDVTIGPGGTLTLNPGVTLQVCGNYTNLGNLIADPTSIIEFIGGANQTINGNVTGTSAFGNLVVNKSGGSVALNTDVEIKRDFLTQNATSVFNCNGYSLSIARNFSNVNGTSTFQSPAGSTLIFNGAAPQTFTNIGSALTLNNVRMAQTINSSLTLAAGAFNNMILGTGGVLTLTNGKIITGANEVIITNTATGASTIGGNTSYVEGWLRRHFGTSVASYEFPVGEATQGWERATVDFTTPPSAPYNVVMRFLRWGGANLPLVNGVYPPLECAGYDWSIRPALNHGYWNSISSTATPTGEYNLTLYNRTYSNYVGVPSAASISHPLGTAQGAPGTLLQFATTATPGFPPLTVGMNVIALGIPGGATITGVTLTTVTLSVPTLMAIPAGQYINFFTPGPTGSFSALTVMKDVNGTGSWTMEATCPCNAAFPPPAKPASKRYAYNASTSGFFNFATVQFGTALPIELISFTAENTEIGNRCKWITASETNNDYFIIERSFDGENFVKIGQVNGYGAGTTTETRYYEFTDTESCDGIVYYRLQQVDIDGANSYSDIVALNCLKSKDALSVYPNPARSTISYSFYEEYEGIINVQIVDVYGKLVSWERFTTTQGLNNLNSSIEQLASGVYYLKLDRMDKSGFVRQVRFMKN